MEINNITTLEQLKDSIINVGIESLPIDNILLQNGWIDERLLQRGICRISNKRLAFNEDIQPVIYVADVKSVPHRKKGQAVYSKNITLTADPELYEAISGVSNRSLFVSDAIIAYRAHVNDYMNYRARILNNPNYRCANIAMNEQALKVLASVNTRHKYMRDAIMAYQKHKPDYIK